MNGRRSPPTPARVALIIAAHSALQSSMRSGREQARAVDCSARARRQASPEPRAPEAHSRKLALGKRPTTAVVKLEPASHVIREARITGRMAGEKHPGIGHAHS